MEREEYLLSNENLKFPTFYGSTLNEYFKNEKMTKEILLKTIHDTLEYLQSMIDLLTDMIRNNKNNFTTICLSYDLNIYDYVIIFKLIKELTIVIGNKINKSQDKIQCKTFEDYFKDDKDKDIIETQHKKKDTKFEIIKDIINQYNDNIVNIQETEHECGIIFIC